MLKCKAYRLDEGKHSDCHCTINTNDETTRTTDLSLLLIYIYLYRCISCDVTTVKWKIERFFIICKIIILNRSLEKGEKNLMLK